MDHDVHADRDDHVHRDVHDDQSGQGGLQVALALDLLDLDF